MILRELVTKLGFDADNTSVNKHESALKRARTAAVALTAAYAATVGAVTAFTARIAGIGDEIAKTSRLVGISTDDLQAWRYAAGQAGVATGTLDSSLRSFNRRIGAAADGGGPAAETLKQLGIEVRNADGSVRGINDVLPEAADKIAALGSEAEKANAAQNLFNASGRQMVLWLDQGSEGMALAQERFEAMGGAMSGEGTANAEALGDALDDVNVIIRSLSFRIGEQLMPMVTETALAMRDWYIRNRQLITQNLKRFIEVLTFAIRTLWNTLRLGFNAIDAVVDKFGGWERVLRIVMAAVLGFIALKLGGMLWAVAGALTGAGAGARILHGALLALSRLPIIALIVGLGLAIEDLIVWINGGDSAIGRWLGSWEDFSAKAKVVIDDVIAYIQPLLDVYRAVGDIIAGVFTLDTARILQGFNDLGDSLTIWALQVGGDMADFLLDMVPSVDEVMAGMRAIGASMLNWAKDMGARMARLLLPEWAQDAIGLNDVPEPPPAPAPSGTNQAPGELVLPEGDAANAPPVSTNRAPDALTVPGETVTIDNRNQSSATTDNRNQSSSNAIINEWVKNQEQNTNNNTTINEWVESQERNRAPDALTVPTPAEQAQRTNEQLAGAFNTPTPERVRENVTNSTTNSRNVTVNARIDSTLQVPQGTPAEQSAALRREAESTFSELFNREINRTLNDMPEVD